MHKILKFPKINHHSRSRNCKHTSASEIASRVTMIAHLSPINQSPAKYNRIKTYKKPKYKTRLWHSHRRNPLLLLLLSAGCRLYARIFEYARMRFCLTCSIPRVGCLLVDYVASPNPTEPSPPTTWGRPLVARIRQKLADTIFFCPRYFLVLVPVVSVAARLRRLPLPPKAAHAATAAAPASADQPVVIVFIIW